MYKTGQALELDLPLPITQWLEDETLYSLCSRHHYVTGNALASNTTQQLFAHFRHGTQHDFPSRINVFVQRTQGLFGSTAREIIYAHTILPFYLPWRSAQQVEHIVRLLSQGQAAKIKSLLGLPSSRIRAHHPLKACPACMYADREHFGVSYWHLTHQLPGVWICPRHDRVILESNTKSTGVGQFLWRLPHKGLFYTPTFVAEKHPLRELAQAAVAVLKLPQGTCIAPDQLVSIYRLALGKKGFLRGRTQIALQEAAEHFFQFTRDLRAVNFDIPVPMSVDQAKSGLWRPLARPQQSAHPLRHLLIILWLFGNWEDFWNVYVDCAERPHHTIIESHADRAVPEQVEDPRIKALISLIQKEGFSITKAARKIGIAVRTAQVWANTHGIPVSRRPKISDSIIKAAILCLRKGVSIAGVSEKYHISTQTVARLLKTEPRLLAHWTLAKHNRTQRNTRDTWMRTIAWHPRAILKELRAMQPACYAWLYRHDREWLTESLSSVPKYRRKNPGHIDWESRDRQLASLVEQVSRNIFAKQHSDKPIQLQQIYQAIPRLKPYAGKLDRLPLTRCAIANVRQGTLTIKKLPTAR